MVYNPALDSIAERVLDNVETTLGTVNGGPTYSSSLVGRVRRWGGNVVEIASFPAAIIVPGNESSDDSQSGRISHVLSIDILLAVRDQNWKEAINKLVADTTVALTNDYTRGGNAMTTRIGSTEVYEGEMDGPLGSARLRLDVLYRTLYHDPTTPI